MKKTFKRAGVAVLSMAMLLSMGAVGAMTASAARSTTVTVPANATTKIPSGATVTWYKVAESTSSGWAWKDSFSITSEQADSLNALKPNTVTETIKDAASIFKVLGNNAVTADSAFVKKLATILDDKTDWTTTETGSTGATGFTISDTSDNSAYYLAKITTSDASYIVQPILFELTSSTATYEVATPKASQVTLDKVITNVLDNTTNQNTNDSGVVGEVKGGGKKALASASDTVSYTITTNLPTYADDVTSCTDFVISDTMTNTLNFNAASIVVTNTSDTATLAKQDADHKTASATIGDGNYQYTLTSTEHGFTVTLADAYVLANKTENISVTFTATLSDTPNYGTTSNDNTAVATFGNDFQTGGGSGTTPNSTVNVYCAKLNVTKTDGSAALPGAGFTLFVKNSSGTYVPVGNEITNTTGNTFEFKDLTKGEYKLEETTVPANHSKGADVEFTITNANFDGKYVSNNAKVTTDVDKTPGIFSTTVVNTPNGALPGTGGMGTTLFTIGGAAIVLLAGAMFVVYMRRRKNEE